MYILGIGMDAERHAPGADAMVKLNIDVDDNDDGAMTIAPI